MSATPATLVVEDGTVFSGLAFGAAATRVGELAFNTAMSGYQEIITDPSYCGQIVTMTCPQIGNYGVNPADAESDRPCVEGFVVRELSRRPSNYRATSSLHEWLAQAGVPGIADVDTRAIARKLRTTGALRAAISTEQRTPQELLDLARDWPGLLGCGLVHRVAPATAYEWTEPSPGRPRPGPADRVVVIDCGVKRNILRRLVDTGCGVTVVPPTASPGEILDLRPAGVLLSNGPGDPEPLTELIGTVRRLIGRVPLFGICLGHQVLGLALGATTYKLKFGHRGANHPVRNLVTGRVEITSQNHGFAVALASLPAEAQATHVNLNDQTLEGFVHRREPLFAVQYHPEAAPGPHDATYLFDLFTGMMRTGRPPSAEQMSAAQDNGKWAAGREAS